MSTSAVFILDLKGKVLICRNYRGDVDTSQIEHFLPGLTDKEEEGNVSPILAHGAVRFLWIKHNNLYLVATTKKNANVALVFAFLYKVVQVFTEYFKELEEESIRDNFVIIYELLDELMDFGFPQTTDSKILQEYITQEGHKLDVGAPRPPATVTNAVSWRSEGIKYRKNEVFLDVIESVNLLVSANGNVLRSEIVGSIKMRVFLSGMPELRLGLNDKVLFENTGRGKSKAVELEDVKFHQCVRLSRFENDRTISFIPPDGEFELMSYRLNTHVKPLIWIESVIEKHLHSRVEIMIKGGKEFLMRAHFGLPSVEADNQEGKPPITVKFEIPYFTTSGIQVRYLKIIEKSGYQALPWVRYITQNGGELSAQLKERTVLIRLQHAMCIPLFLKFAFQVELLTIITACIMLIWFVHFRFVPFCFVICIVCHRCFRLPAAHTMMNVLGWRNILVQMLGTVHSEGCTEFKYNTSLFQTAMEYSSFDLTSLRSSFYCTTVRWSIKLVGEGGVCVFIYIYLPDTHISSFV
uniref:Adaptor related protein complex 1 subunit mu 1 n=1 Tax=Eptatretus burgeri TaxID=7764 RepID=A0A8C4WYG6_EPTBU